MADSISAIPANPYIKSIADFLRYLQEEDQAEGMPTKASPFHWAAKLLLPQASTVENLAYGNSPFTMAPEGTGSKIPIVKTGRKGEVADIIGTATGGVPGTKIASELATTGVNKLSDLLVQGVTRNPSATAMGVLDEAGKIIPLSRIMAKEEKPVGSLSIQDIATPYKSPLGFYSKLEEATIPLQNKGTGSQYLAQIEKTAGVKPEEIQWTGLDEFLKSKPNVTKQEVRDYLAANRVDLQEVRLGQGTVKTFEQWAADQGFGPDAIRDFGPTLRNSYEAFKENASQKIGAAKFSQYTLPGGENYREILLTLPEREPQNLNDIAQGMFGKRFSDLGDSEANRVVLAEQAQKRGENFRSSHFDQPNILAHMRVNDRVVDGKKTLFIEEVQSDWHQAGRKKGYGSKTTYDIMAPDGTWYNQLSDRALAEQQAKEIGGVVQEKTLAGVPDAPFKTTWHELALKRAIQEASEKGYDRIAFTTGKTQAERYDLSKQIDRIAITKTGGVWSVNAWKDGTKAITKDASTDADLANLVGKELAEKAIKQGGGEYAGLDLQVGGEGMKGFYDNILPKSLDKLGKKFDAKVTKTKMKSAQKGFEHFGEKDVEIWTMDITPKMRESVVKKGQPLFVGVPFVAGQDQDKDPLEQFLQSKEPVSDPFMRFLGYQ